MAASRWIENDAALNRALAPFGRLVLDAANAQRGERIADIGCGGGSTTVELARRVAPEGHVMGVDISASLLAHARDTAPSDVAITWINADASTWTAPEPVDLVFSRFGIMFFTDPHAAFRNLVGNLREGGRLCVACWCTLAENPWIEQCLAVMEGLVEDPWPSASGPGPLSLGQEDELRAVLTSAGLEGIDLRRVEAPVVFSEEGLEPAIEFAMRAGPTSRVLIDATQEVRLEARRRMAMLLERHLEEGGVALSGTCWIASGTSR